MAKRAKKIQHGEIVQRFAVRLREVRSSRGMTQAQLAHQAQVTLSYIGRLEAGGAAPGIDLVERLAGALGTTVSDLLPVVKSPETTEFLAERARQLFDGLVDGADHEMLLMLNPLLARLAESKAKR
jgi:transcriptional regulator with XRE-family HTH domain